MAVGNGLGSGIVMTLGADAAPAVGRAQFLGGWRLCGDIGGTGGPLLIGAVAAVTTLATASVVIGLLGLLGSAWVGHWVRDSDRRRTASGSPETYLTLTRTSLDTSSLAVSRTRNRFSPVCPVCTYVENVSLLTTASTLAKSTHSSLT